jgi:peptide/nickel transport system permease protein
MAMTGPDPLTAARPDKPVAKTRRLRLSGGGFWTALWRSRSGKIGLILVGITLIGALVSILGLTPYDPQYQDPNANLVGPNAQHLLGTDNFGRDMFSLVLQGIVVSLEIAVIATLIAGVFGTIGGIVAGYLGGTTSTLIMRASDMLFAIPAILLALAIVTALGPGILDSALAIGIGWIPIFIRVVRAPVLSLRNADFVRAGQVLGFSPGRVLFRHILPSVYGVIAVQTSLALAWAILADASLSFLGLGPPPPAASLGQMVENSSSIAEIAWWTLAVPSAAIVIAVIGFNYLGDGIRDAADPRSRKS